MFAKVLIVCAVVVVALGIEYPPGLHPALCPNYPYCDMAVLARHTPQGLPIPEWELPYYARFMTPYSFAPIPFAANIPAAPIAVAAALPVTTESAPEPAKYPADFDPATCPNYPFCA